MAHSVKARSELLLSLLVSFGWDSWRYDRSFRAKASALFVNECDSKMACALRETSRWPSSQNAEERQGRVEINKWIASLRDRIIVKVFGVLKALGFR